MKIQPRLLGAVVPQDPLLAPARVSAEGLFIGSGWLPIKELLSLGSVLADKPNPVRLSADWVYSPQEPRPILGGSSKGFKPQGGTIWFQNSESQRRYQ